MDFIMKFFFIFTYTVVHTQSLRQTYTSAQKHISPKASKDSNYPISLQIKDEKTKWRSKPYDDSKWKVKKGFFF